MIHRLLVTSLTLLCLLGIIPHPCKAQQTGVIYACVNVSDGSMRIVSTPTSCKKNEKLLSWNVQGIPGDPLPPWQGSTVNCGSGGKISDALAYPAQSLTINITGTCNEEIVINRDHVILQAADPANPPTLTHDGTPVVVNQARDISLLNLKITGSLINNGVLISNSHVTVVSCNIWNKGTGIWMEGPSVVDIRNSQIHNNGTGIGVGFGGVLSISDTKVDWNTGGGIGMKAATLHAADSTINHNSLGIELGHNSAVILEFSDVSFNKNEGIGAGGSTIHMSDSTLTNNGIAGIWAESTDVMLYGNNRILNNIGQGLALTAGSSLTSRMWTGPNLIKDNIGCGLAMTVSSFAIWEGVKIEQPDRCAISCDTCLAICDPAYITGAISGCGPRCQR